MRNVMLNPHLARILLVCLFVVLSFKANTAHPFEGIADHSRSAYSAYKDGDHAEALRIWQAQAEQGDSNAQNNLGMLYLYGDGVEINVREAVKWFQKALEQGNVSAKFNLGVLYAKGKGVKKNPFYAYQLLLEAASQNIPFAQYNLDRLCIETPRACEFGGWETPK